MYSPDLVWKLSRDIQSLGRSPGLHYKIPLFGPSPWKILATTYEKKGS